MFSIEKARLYCIDDFSLIENYDKASKDLIQTWDIHHRKEEEGYSKQELKDKGMYYKRPASELIFLTKFEHRSLHSKNRYRSVETKRKISDALKGEKHPLYGKTGDEHPLSKPIQQIDKKTGQVIKTWPCVREVERVLGIYSGNISKCCSGKRKSAGGYIWKFA